MSRNVKSVFNQHVDLPYVKRPSKSLIWYGKDRHEDRNVKIDPRIILESEGRRMRRELEGDKTNEGQATSWRERITRRRAQLDEKNKHAE
ncbi:hypothetical protein BDN70DRAFT_653506 [Pholiota conissans]|uniref:Uncharacterized protein n=1 Tax=Pholiota conissans TaxID=109636 RepID=A0A9P6CR33_9AGAR|nr:hypothetical protein BDN70DRAFT_653506 [Pholiota conissans]